MVGENADKSGTGPRWSQYHHDLRVRLCSLHGYGKVLMVMLDLTLAMHLLACYLMLLYFVDSEAS
jgi:hypothetical protein